MPRVPTQHRASQPAPASRPALQVAGHVRHLLGLALAVAAYIAWHLSHWPAPAYLPETGTWSIAAPDGVIAMRYYGWLLVGLVAYALGYGAGRLPTVEHRLSTGAGATWLTRIVLVEMAASLTYLAVAELSHWAR